jgi:multiple sugar transport system substrate-binding protein
LRLVVIDDPALAGVIERQWQARSSGPFSVSELATAAFLAAPDTLHADVVVFPSCLLGDLVERQLIRPLPRQLQDSTDFARLEIFDQVRLHEVSWARQAYAAPLGSAQFVLAIRTDVFQQVQQPPPATWEEYGQLLAELVKTKTPGAQGTPRWPTYPTVEPLASGWAGRMLLARVAASIYNRSRYSTVFDFRSLEPVIAHPPFVRALEELTSAYRAGPPEAIDFTPDDTMRFFLAGNAAMSITWPTAGRTSAAPISDAVPLRFIQLPGSDHVYDFPTQRWQPRPNDQQRHVPVLAIAGRLAAITRQTRQIHGAAGLLRWLTGRQHSVAIAPRSTATTLFRQSHVAEPGRWIDPSIEPTAAQEYAELVARTQSLAGFLMAPRIPGQHLYMQALDDAVRRAACGTVAPQEALDHAVQRWRQITDELGLEAQRTAYHRSLGLD